MTRNAYLGSDDWRHKEWIGDFYPDDMPEEWRLAFYSSQYSCVWLNHACWARIGASEWEDWINETRAGFCFLLERPRENEAGLDELLGASQGRALAFAEKDERIIWFDAASELETMANNLRRRLFTRSPVFVVSRDARLEKMEQVSTLLELLGA